MEVAVHIPVIDLRVLLTNSHGRKRRPLWPVGYVDQESGRSEFVGGFGALRTTPAASHGNWEGRRQHVSGARAFRFPDDLGSAFRWQLASDQAFSLERATVNLQVVSRRFYGSAVSPRGFLEVRLSIADLPLLLSWADLSAVNDSLLRLPIRLGREDTTHQLSAISQPLADYVRLRTTRADYNETAPRWAVQGGPVQVAFFTAFDLSGDPDANGFTEVPTDTGTANVFHRSTGHCATWLVGDSSAQRRRTIALHLSRLHSERTTFVAILGALTRSAAGGDGLMSADSPLVQGALANSAAYLERKRSHGTEQHGLLEVIEWDLGVHGDDWDLLENSLRRMPHALSSKVVNIVTNNDLRGARGIQLGGQNRMQNRFPEKD